MSQVRNIVGGVVAFGMSLLNPSCTTPDVSHNTKDKGRVLQEVIYDRPQTDADSIYKDIHKDYGIKAAELRHNMDSAAFKDMFDGTYVARNSQFVEEYNSMIAKTRVQYIQDFAKNDGHYFADEEKMTSTLNEMKELDKGRIMRDSKISIADSVTNSKLVKKYWLTDSAGMNRFSKIFKKVRP